MKLDTYFSLEDFFKFRRMVTEKLFNFYSLSQILKSSVKTFDYKNYLSHLLLIISSYFKYMNDLWNWITMVHYTPLISASEKKTFRNCSTFTLTTMH